MTDISDDAKRNRLGGRLWFLRNSPLAILCAIDDGPPVETLQRSQRGLGRIEWPGEVGVEWQLPHGALRGDGVAPSILGMNRIIGDDSLRRALSAIAPAPDARHTEAQRAT